MTRIHSVRQRLIVGIGVLGACLATSGCSAGPSSDEPSGTQDDLHASELHDEPWEAPFGGTRECWMTAAECKWQYDQCADNCWTYIDPGFDCLGSCRDSWCWPSTGSDEYCSLHHYHFDGGQRIAELEQACLDAAARDTECGEHNVYENCEVVATVESAEMTAMYTCISQTPCGDSLDPCVPQESYELGDEICEAVDESCQTQSCSQMFHQVLSWSSPWWRQEVIEGAQACLGLLGCREKTTCLVAWSDAALASTGLDDFLLWSY